MEGKKRISGLKLALKTSVVSGMTLLSRILGLVRDVVFARFFGAGLLMDAFLVAQRIPNMLRRFFAEGAFSAGFVPVMARYKEQHDHDEAREYLDAMAGTFGIVLFVVTLLGVIGAPLLVLIVAPGFVSDGGDFDLAALMLRFTFPYLFFVSLTAFAGGIFNTYGRFGVPAFTPVMLNVVLDRCSGLGGAAARAADHGSGLRRVHSGPAATVIPTAVSREDSRAAAAQMAAATRRCQAGIQADGAGDLWFVGGADQRPPERHHRFAAAGGQYQLPVLLGSPYGVSARPVRDRARDRDFALPLAALGQR